MAMSLESGPSHVAKLQAIGCCLAGSSIPGGHAAAGLPACVVICMFETAWGVLWQGGEVRKGESENTTRELPSFGLASILLLLGRQFKAKQPFKAGIAPACTCLAQVQSHSHPHSVHLWRSSFRQLLRRRATASSIP